MLNKILEWDQELFLLLNGLGSEVYDSFWVFVSSTKSALPLFVFITYLLFKTFGRSFWQALLLILITVGLVDFCSVYCFKNVFMRLRPCHAPELADQIRLLVSKGGVYGFVSSHAANFFALAAICTAILPERKFIFYLLYSWAIFVAYSRIYVGKHYLLDVLGGAILGLVIAKVMWRLVKKIKEKYTLAL